MKNTERKKGMTATKFSSDEQQEFTQYPFYPRLLGPFIFQLQYSSMKDTSTQGNL